MVPQSATQGREYSPSRRWSFLPIWCRVSGSHYQEYVDSIWLWIFNGGSCGCVVWAGGKWIPTGGSCGCVVWAAYGLREGVGREEYGQFPAK